MGVTDTTTATTVLMAITIATTALSAITTATMAVTTAVTEDTVTAATTATMEDTATTAGEEQELIFLCLKARESYQFDGLIRSAPYQGAERVKLVNYGTSR